VPEGGALRRSWPRRTIVHDRPPPIDPETLAITGLVALAPSLLMPNASIGMGGYGAVLEFHVLRPGEPGRLSARQRRQWCSTTKRR